MCGTLAMRHCRPKWNSCSHVVSNPNHDCHHENGECWTWASASYLASTSESWIDALSWRGKVLHFRSCDLVNKMFGAKTKNFGSMNGTNTICNICEKLAFMSGSDKLNSACCQDWWVFNNREVTKYDNKANRSRSITLHIRGKEGSLSIRSTLTHVVRLIRITPFVNVKPSRRKYGAVTVTA